MTKNRGIVDSPSSKTKTPQKRGSKQKANQAALCDQAQRLKQLEIISLFGKIDYYPNYDYKTERRRKRKGIENADD